MEWVAEALKAIFGRVWFTSFVVLIFCVSSNVAVSQFGLEIPTMVTEWLNVGLLASFSILVTQTLFSILVFIRSRYAAWKGQRGAWEDARLNITALYPREAATLRMMLSDQAPPRFTVSPTNNLLWPLLSKGILVTHSDAGTSGYICSVAPSIYAKRHEIIPTLPTTEQVDEAERRARAKTDARTSEGW